MAKREKNIKFTWLLAITAVLMLTVVSGRAEVNTFHVVVNANGYVEEGWCDGPYPEWYYYRNTNWWNQWFYNGPYDPDRKKVIDVSIFVIPYSPVAGSYVEIAYNWSSPEWPGGGEPPLPQYVQDPELEQLYIKRHTFKTLETIPPNGTTISSHLEIQSYNPEWVSIDVRGSNFVIDGTIDHRCIEKPAQRQACCLPDDTCIDTTEEDCKAIGGDPQGTGTNCATTICSQLTEACCFPDDSCQDLPSDECLRQGGDPQGIGTDCATTICSQPTEACCLLDGSCIDTNINECFSIGGVPQGPGTDCATVDCGCDWQLGDPHKMHWPQLPDLSPTGLDVDIFWTRLADDFLCTETGPIKDIHIWGSFADDYLPPSGVENLTFQATIYSNIPPDDITPWSRPGDILWTREFVPYEYTVGEVADDIVEGWFDPATGFYDPANHSRAYQFNFCIEEDPFIQEKGKIYWLEVIDILPVTHEPGYTFGWKTTTPDLRWNDDAVWLTWDFGWVPLTYPDIPGIVPHPYAGQTLDLAFVITGEIVSMPEMDFGDAPERPYPTTLAADGARHVIIPVIPGIFLGNGVDPEPDGQPDATATGDDNDGNDDEDGVVFTSLLIPGQLAIVNVTANAQGFLDAWVDFNGDGSWADAGDQIFAVRPLVIGPNLLTFPVPPTATPNITTFARFRFSSQGGLSYKGLAFDGEVEDYPVGIKEPCKPECKPPVEHLKWSQPPIEIDPTSSIPVYCGWDELSSFSGPMTTGVGLWKLVADDFRCLGSMPIASVHWWGSHLGWDGSEPPHLPKAFHIGFWTNVAAGYNPHVVPFSHPGKLLWEVYSYNYDCNFVGYDRFPMLEQLIADNPYVTVQGNEDFNWAGFNGWWIRGDSADVEFMFTGLDPAAISGSHVLVKFNLGVTNHLNGEEGLDGLVDVTINPGLVGWTYTVKDVLFDNLDAANHVYAMGTGGTYETTASILVHKSYIQGGILTIKVHRNRDVKDTLPAAPVSTNQPIDTSTVPPTVPTGCYDFDDAHTVHIHVATTNANGTVAANGEVTLWAEADQEACFQYYAKFDPNEYFRQGDFLDQTQDNVYWISIAAIYDDIAENAFPWGWKTRPRHWMDDAVVIRDLVYDELKPDLELNPSQVTPIENASLCDQTRSYDMTFELDTDPNYVKWEQPFTSLRCWPHYEDEESIALEQTIIEPKTKWIQHPDLTELGIDIDATTQQGDWLSQTLADDFLCTDTSPLTDIHIWGSWRGDNLPEQNSAAVAFTLSIYSDVPASQNLAGYSMPGELLWQRQFSLGEFNVERVPTDAPESYYNPCMERYEPADHQTVFRYDFNIDPSEAFMQNGSKDKPIVYWLSVQAQPISNPGIALARFGWKTSQDHWNDDAVWRTDVMPISRPWDELRYPSRHPMHPESIDLAFEIGTRQEKTELTVRRLVADDWKCRYKTPITAAVWWGSYKGYEYEACSCQQGPPPVKPDYFLLSIWTDVPDPNIDDPEDYSHPGEKIWEYEAYHYDEVLVGHDKHTGPIITIYPPPPAPHEPVYRYSVRLPKDKWFCQEDVNDIYWFSVVAVYQDQNEPQYPWGWTNHKCSPWEPPGLVEVAHWQMDETSSITAHDSSGNANHGTLVGDASWVPCCGSLCGAIDLDGDGDYVKTADTTTGLDFAPGSFSVSVRINAREVADGWRTILEYDRDGSDNNRFGLWLSSLGKFHFRVGLDTQNTNQTLQSDKWYMVTGTYDAIDKTMRLYVDGQFDTSAVHSNGYESPSATKLTIGVRGSENAEYFDGLIDDVRIYNRVLSSNEIQALSNITRNDDAVAGSLDISDIEPKWSWVELYDQVGMSEDMSFILFTEPGCFPCCHEDYFEWLSVGKPDCWCYPRQCHGDADNKSQGKKKYWVSTNDLDILIAAWNKPFADIEGVTLYGVPLICADFAHDTQGKKKYRVSTNDLDILIANWNRANKPDPNCLNCD